MRSDKELLGIQNYLVIRAEGTDFLSTFSTDCDLTEEEIAYIRSLGDQIREKQEPVKSA